MRRDQEQPSRTGASNHAESSLAHDIVVGAAAGLAAAWIMDVVTTWMLDHQDPSARRRENDVRSRYGSDRMLPDKVERALGEPLSEPDRQRINASMHWILGLGGGAAYALLRRQASGVGAGHGLLYGTGFFLAIDEAANTLAGLAPPPTMFPWQTHFRGLVGHWTFGLATDLILAAERRVRGR